MSKRIPADIMKALTSVTNKRAKFVIDTILEKGQCTTEDLKDAGYEHAPRAARDVRELGIPLKTIRVKDREGKSIAAYVFGDWNEMKGGKQLSKSSGRNQLSKKLKQALIDKYGCRCNLYNEEYPERLLQPDHRIPYEIGGDPADMLDTDYFMLLCPSANRDKSWSCEHCPNWRSKDPNICYTCYYAFPEKYNHIACRKEHKVDLVFSDHDNMIYEHISTQAKKEHISVQDCTKRILAYYYNFIEKRK